MNPDIKDILQVTIVTGQGVNTYLVGELINGKTIHKIGKQPIHFTGDPFDHYVGRDDSGAVLFSINCLIPCEIIYR